MTTKATAQINLNERLLAQSWWASRNDDHPETNYYQLWTVDILVKGFVSWGPFKYRPNAKKQHSGSAFIKLLKGETFRSKDEKRDSSEEALRELESQAVEYALKAAELLEEKGFQVEITEGPELFKKTWFEPLNGRVVWEDTQIPKTWRDEVDCSIDRIKPKP